MDDELQVARKKTEGWAKLLDRVGYRVSTAKSDSGDKRKEVPTTSRGNEVGAIPNTPAKSKVSGKAKGANGVPAKHQGRRRNSSDRKQNRRNEGKDAVVRRNPKELGVVFPGHFCDDASLYPHHWIDVDMVASGVMFQCMKCRNYLWLPMHDNGAKELGILMRKYGSDDGYYEYLNNISRRPAKIMLAKLQRLYKLSSTVIDSLQFGKEVDKILSVKEYDKEVADGQELSHNLH